MELSNWRQICLVQPLLFSTLFCILFWIYFTRPSCVPLFFLIIVDYCSGVSWQQEGTSLQSEFLGALLPGRKNFLQTMVSEIFHLLLRGARLCEDRIVKCEERLSCARIVCLLSRPFLDLMTWGSRGYAICRLVGCASRARNDVPCEDDVKWCEERCWSFFYDLNLVNYFSTLIPLIPMCETVRGTSFSCEDRFFRVRNVTPIFLCFCLL